MVDNLASQSTCHQAAAAQLLVTCKKVGATLTKEEGKHELLERAKSVYAVRVAVCETGEGKATVPNACQPILQIPQRLDHEIDVVNSRTLAFCLGELTTIGWNTSVAQQCQAMPGNGHALELCTEEASTAAAAGVCTNLLRLLAFVQVMLTIANGMPQTVHDVCAVRV